MTALVLVTAILIGQSSTPATQQDTAETIESRESIELSRAEVAKYHFYVDQSPDSKLLLHAEPILRWTNHLQRRFYGDVFVWTRHGRPEVVATITNSYGGYHAMETEAHSLSLGKFRATNGEQPLWSPSVAGVTFADVPDTPAVADAPARRLLQMREIARRFAAISTAGSQHLQLRMLSQPVFRYASTDQAISDGAMFVFANGTDPEIFLLIESRQSGTDTTWQYAIARFNSHVELRVSIDNGDVVWSVPRLRGGVLKNPESTYFAFQRRISPGAAEERTDR